MTTRQEEAFAQVALDHLMMIDLDAALPNVRMHCYFARVFLQLAIEAGQQQAVTTGERAVPGRVARTDGLAT